MKKVSWRSRFWNFVLTVVMAGFLAIFIAITIDRFTGLGVGSKVSGIGFGIGALLFLLGTLQAPRVGVTASDKGIIIRTPVRTRRIPWGEISDIRLGGLNSGVPGVAGAQAPIVLRESADGSRKPIILKELGSYNVGQGKSLAETATRALRSYHQEIRLKDGGSEHS